VVSHNRGIGDQAKQAHLRNPTKYEVILLLVEPALGDAMMNVPRPDRRQPETDIHQNHCRYRSMSSAAKAASMSALVTSTSGSCSRPINGKSRRPLERDLARPRTDPRSS